MAATIAGSDRAPDAAQEAFIRAHRALPKFDATRPFRPWLLRIVANTAKNEIRTSMRHLRLVDRARTVVIEVASSDDPAIRSEERQRLVVALSSLSVDDRTVLALRWFEQLSEAEIASVLGVRPGTAKSRLHRAMSRLRAAFGPEEVGDE